MNTTDTVTHSKPVYLYRTPCKKCGGAFESNVHGLTCCVHGRPARRAWTPIATTFHPTKSR